MSDFKIKIDGKELAFQTADAAFVPTGTSSLMIECVKNYVKEPVTLLDLGCGIGIVGVALSHCGIVKDSLYASDLGHSAVAATIENAKTHHCNVVAKEGSIFSPWGDMKFDCIVDDISGIAGEVARVSPWFDGVDCDAGEDGSELVVQVINEAAEHLNENGLLFLPAISLSNITKIMNAAKQNFKHVECLGRQTWPLPKSMLPHKALLQDLHSKGLIQIEERFGGIQWFTEIIVAHNR